MWWIGSGRTVLPIECRKTAGDDEAAGIPRRVSRSASGVEDLVLVRAVRPLCAASAVWLLIVEPGWSGCRSSSGRIAGLSEILGAPQRRVGGRVRAVSAMTVGVTGAGLAVPGVQAT